MTNESKRISNALDAIKAMSDDEFQTFMEANEAEMERRKEARTEYVRAMLGHFILEADKAGVLPKEWQTAIADSAGRMHPFRTLRLSKERAEEIINAQTKPAKPSEAAQKAA